MQLPTFEQFFLYSYYITVAIQIELDEIFPHEHYF